MAKETLTCVLVVIALSEFTQHVTIQAFPCWGRCPLLALTPPLDCPRPPHQPLSKKRSFIIFAMFQHPFSRVFYVDFIFLIGVPSDFIFLFLFFCMYPCKSLLPLDNPVAHSIALKFTTSLSKKLLKTQKSVVKGGIN